MSSTIKLGSRPKNFKKTVKVTLLDGTVASVEITYKYRTRKEFGAFIDKITAAARAAEAARKAADETAEAQADAGIEKEAEDKPFSLEELMDKTAGANADYVMDVVEAWNLDVPLSKTAVEQLADEIPAAVNIIMESYRVAITEGRLGN